MDALQRIASGRANAADPLGEVLGRGEAVADSASSIQHARRTSATVSSAAGPIAFATAGVAMLVLPDRGPELAGSAAARGHRRSRCAAPGRSAIAVKALLELLLPLLVGAARRAWLASVLSFARRAEHDDRGGRPSRTASSTW